MRENGEPSPPSAVPRENQERARPVFYHCNPSMVCCWRGVLSIVPLQEYQGREKLKEKHGIKRRTGSEYVTFGAVTKALSNQ